MLLPHSFKKVGWFLLIPSLLFGIYLIIGDFQDFQIGTKMFVIYSDAFTDKVKFFGLANVPITNTVVGVIFLVGALFVGFSRERVEDEYIKSLRLSSLQWAVLVNYLLLIVAFLFIYGFSFLNVMLYNMFTVLILFIGRFNFLLFMNSKILKNEK